MQPDRSILLTFDIEDWFQVENLKKRIAFSSWPHRELRVEENTKRLLDTLDSSWESGGVGGGVEHKATFFILGWVAKRVPRLVREISERGHEIASHGLSHNLCYPFSLKELRNDLYDSRKILEDITGLPVYGYRAPSFSIGPEVLEVIQECGYTYDSSYNSFAGNPRYGRLNLVRNGLGIASRVLPALYELPISNLEIGNYTIPVGGGGYFRIMPVGLFKRAVRSIISKLGVYLFYLHPWELDPGQPRVKGLPLSFRFRHYANLHSTVSKLTDFITAFGGCRFLSCRDYIDRMVASESGGASPMALT